MTGTAMIAGSCIVAFGVYAFGMILLSIAGGTNGRANIPRAFELTMLLLWPAALAITAILPGLLLLGGTTWQWPLRIAIGGGVLCLLWWFVGMGLMMIYGTKPAVSGFVKQHLPPPMKAAVEHANQFSIDEQKCTELALPPVAFAISWPDNVQRVTGNPAYGSVYLRLQRVNEAGAVLEELEIVAAAGIRAEHDSSSGLPHPENVAFNQLVEQAKMKLESEYHLNVVHYSWDWLETNRQIQADRKAIAATERPKSILQFMLSPPRPRENGLHVTMRSYDGSNVKRSMKFEEVGMPQEVLSSFYWLERN